MSEDAAALEARLGHSGSHEHYLREDWQMEVADGDTSLGYWDWVENNLDLFGIPELEEDDA
jgi:hypothetical protein